MFNLINQSHVMKKFIVFSFCLSICTISILAGTPKLGKSKLDHIIAAMTLEEKASLLVGAGSDQENSMIISSAGLTREIPRLGICQTNMNDGPTGLRMDTLRAGYPDKRYYCTGFPVATMLSCTWNEALVEEVGEAIGKELVAYGCDLLLAPSLNIQRSPLCGRDFEYYSEDPLVAGKTAAAMIRGLQSTGVGATAKHFAVNSQQTFRVHNDARVSQRALREIYLKNFEIAVKEGKPRAIMSSLNKVNGNRTCGSWPLLTGILRNEWGWDGIVMTDWFRPEVTRDLVHAGNDLMMGGCKEQVEEIIAAVNDGSLSMEDVDRNVRRVLEYILETPSYAGHKPTYEPDLCAGAEVALKAAREGLVLLKNEGGTLPLAEDETVALFGIGSYLFHANGLGSADVNKAYTVNMMQGLKEAGINLNPIVDEYYRSYMATENIQLRETNTKTWRNWFFGYKEPYEARITGWFLDKRAADCSKAVITIARNGGECLDKDYAEGEYLMTREELELIENVCTYFHKAGKKVVVVINTGFPIEIASWKEKPDAILLAWQPGQEGGHAVAEALKGDVNPSGKLTMTWANDYFDIPSSANFPIHDVFTWAGVNTFPAPAPELLAQKDRGTTVYEEDIWLGYRWFNTKGKEVAYPFGYGLSYTEFGYSDARILDPGKAGKKKCKVSVKVTNTGKRAGKEVVELYSTAPETPGFDCPLRELKAYAKTPMLAPGESTEVILSFDPADLASFHEDGMSWVAPAGEYILSVGASVEDIRESLCYRLSKEWVKKVENML